MLTPKSYQFALRIINLCKFLIAEQKEFAFTHTDCKELIRLLAGTVKSTEQNLKIKYSFSIFN